jgi:transcriptional regulator with XRE-family HTH domain
MSLKEWETNVLEAAGAGGRVRDIEDELRLAAGLTALRERAGLSQRELAKRVGVSQPRIAAIERSRNVTIDILEQYVGALGARLEVSVVQGRRRTPLVGDRSQVGRSRAGATRSSTAATGKVAKEATTAARKVTAKAKTSAKPKAKA